MKILFIINPKSGKGRDPRETIDCIQLNFPAASWALTEAPGHATQLAQKAVEQGYNAVVAIGGDGTINETARALVHTQTALGVVPNGSGNGLAREMGMPLSIEESLLRLQTAHAVRCDAGKANGEIFLNLAGVGIEAQIAYDFMQYGKSGKRGMWPYFKLGAKDVLTYRPQPVELELDGKKSTVSPLSVAFANGTQYGSNFKIAPQASLTDGWLECVLIKNESKLKLLSALPSFFGNDPSHKGVTQTTQVKKAVLRKAGEIIYHLDGEPKTTQDRLEITIEPGALNLLLPVKAH